MKYLFPVIVCTLGLLMVGCAGSSAPPPQDGQAVNASKDGKAKKGGQALEKFDTPPLSTGPKK